MPRNNQDRLGTQDEGQNPPIQDQVKSVLDFVMPTEHVELPTKGKFYSQDHPLHNVESVEIKYMTAKETDILTSQTLLKKGLAIDRMLQGILLDKKIRVEDLYVGDKNALIVAARISGFGRKYETSTTCTGCGSSTNQSFDLGDINVKELSEDIEFTENGTFFVELPQTKVRVECRLLTATDEKKLIGVLEKKRKLKLPETSMTDQFKSFMVSLNGEAERSLVEEFVEIMPAIDSNHLLKEYEKAKPDLDLSYSLDCETCGANSVVKIPFSTNFFWPK